MLYGYFALQYLFLHDMTSVKLWQQTIQNKIVENDTSTHTSQQPNSSFCNIAYGRTDVHTKKHLLKCVCMFMHVHVHVVVTQASSVVEQAVTKF